MAVAGGAEGATAPETLRPKDRGGDERPLWKAGGAGSIATTAVGAAGSRSTEGDKRFRGGAARGA